MAISFVGAAQANSGNSTNAPVDITYPPGITSGDLIILFATRGLEYDITVGPSGYTWVRNITDPGVSPAAAEIDVYYKVADGTESGTVTNAYTLSSGSRYVNVVAVYRGVDTTASPFIAEGAAAKTTGNSVATLTTPTLNNTDAGAWAVAVWTMRQVNSPASWTADAALTERIDQDTATNSSVNVTTMMADSNGTVATGNLSYTSTQSSGSSIAATWFGLLKPASSSGTQAISPTGIASAEAFGTARLDLDIQPTGIASGEAFGTPELISGFVLAPTGIASAQAFGTPSVTTGPVTIQPTGISSQEVVPSPSVTRTGDAQEILVSPIYTAEAFGTPTVLAHQIIQARSIESREAFGAARVKQEVFLATPPQVLEPPAAFESIHYRVDIPRGITAYRQGGVWKTTRYAPDDLVAEVYYRGGYEYVVDKATADALLLQGFSVRTEIR